MPIVMFAFFFSSVLVFSAGGIERAVLFNLAFGEELCGGMMMHMTRFGSKRKVTFGFTSLAWLYITCHV